MRINSLRDGLWILLIVTILGLYNPAFLIILIPLLFVAIFI